MKIWNINKSQKYLDNNLSDTMKAVYEISDLRVLTFLHVQQLNQKEFELWK